MAFILRPAGMKNNVYWWLLGPIIRAKRAGGFIGWVRESTLSWKEVLLDLKNRGLEVGPNLCIGDGALGFWKALSEVYGQAAQQRCWVHKTRNVLDKLPDSVQNQAKEGLHKIWQNLIRRRKLKKLSIPLSPFMRINIQKQRNACQKIGMSC